ncbi:unnamed protein product [Hymenolepis diminuta]|uniref:Thymosin beta n=1 Tax=Hymenolepis diminuta TaxID=6216 RepID=A0A0R3SHU6_HYMDI|nr:unnamed protein product [Hymenolepis diminuta]VUZ42160.1 unnamed protein product [Hymenolepis diminuta]
MGEPTEVISAVSDFNKDVLKHVEPEVKNPLPTADDIKKEKEKTDLLKEIAEGTELKHAVTIEKMHMPTAKEIEQEKAAAEK